MTSRTILLGLAENNAWSNQRLLNACAALTREEMRAVRTSFFPSIHETLVHIVAVDEYYLDALRSGGRGRSVFDDLARFDDFAALRKAQRAVDHDLVSYVADASSDSDFDATVAIQRVDHTQHEKVGDVLLHLFEHQIHHRGQAHAMLAGTHVKPPQLDEFFLAEELPLREKELRELGLRVR